ncbi:DUF4433 domain-containing protein [Croceibacterium sp. LX-88]|uniref:DUF4433 domain-containing protein n=1 Tax=Croceibacterium selenioxidans TaxID=2838833 RepID=A0ABS5W0S7_9SPHN|nr:DarT ssDNA thymidine ADP-ribosyltransferase family protein [Croceibacterium selenioxidans]MBT2133370.1 DUF4433 domain-containing protein [Croceibacterium selenioxidans]
MKENTRLPDRFIFRQVYYPDIEHFARDGEIRSKNHVNPQPCHQTSYQSIVSRRGTDEFEMPCGGVANDYVPFYFSPITSFTYTIYKGNVDLRSPAGQVLGIATQDSRAFVVSRADRVLGNVDTAYFTNTSLNSKALEVRFGRDICELEDVVNWSLFDDTPKVGAIPEIGYDGVCFYFKDRATPAAHQNRSRERMAELLVKNAFPFDLTECILVKTPEAKARVDAILAQHEVLIPVYVNIGCYY